MRTENPGENPGETPNEKPGEKPNEKPDEKPGAMPGEKPNEKPGEQIESGETVEKVAAFVTRDPDPLRAADPLGDPASGHDRQLLVFRHPNPRAGIQVPAGTVEPGESLHAAVLREAAEETGLADLAIVGDPIRAPLELADDEWYLVLHAGGRELLTALDLDRPVVRVAHEEPDRLLLAGTRWSGEPIEWWAAPSLVTRDVRRWLFHLAAPPHTPDRWQHTFDTPDPWHFYWIPATAEPLLVGPQSAWLALMRPRLFND
jgi:8-oxo-dGTP pyrophosphatase MutT (NUDIX family)